VIPQVEAELTAPVVGNLRGRVFDCADAKDASEPKKCAREALRASKNSKGRQEVHHVAALEELGSPSDLSSESDDPGAPAPPTAGAKRKAGEQNNDTPMPPAVPER
jgi:hypothetical protein